jgi:F5/8 type C domain
MPHPNAGSVLSINLHRSGPSSASSVLQNNGKLYGAQNGLEDSDTRCWNSDQGDMQFYIVKFGRSVKVLELKLQFQAGFSSEIIKVQVSSGEGTWEEVDELEPRDTLGLQTFQFEKPVECSLLRLDFEDFKDFYGRITLYKIQAWGHEAN